MRRAFADAVAADVAPLKQPVSYTHLDVYKRQLQSRLGPYVDETLARVVLGEMDADEAQTFLDGLYERGMQEMIDLRQSVAVRLGV